MVDVKRTFQIVKTPVIILTALVCVGILINFLDTMVIMVWWSLVLILCMLATAWNGYRTVREYKLPLFEAGISGIATWLVPGGTGLVIGGLSSFVSALLWGAIEGYETIAFIVGAIVITLLIAIGAGFSFCIGWFGGFLAQRFSAK